MRLLEIIVLLCFSVASISISFDLKAIKLFYGSDDWGSC
jgi:hypothetical protein